MMVWRWGSGSDSVIGRMGLMKMDKETAAVAGLIRMNCLFIRMLGFESSEAAPQAGTNALGKLRLAGRWSQVVLIGCRFA